MWVNVYLLRNGGFDYGRMYTSKARAKRVRSDYWGRACIGTAYFKV